jgi:hypothetical protein
MLLLGLFALLQDYTLAGDGHGTPGDGTQKPAIVVVGRTNLPEGAIVSVTLWYGEARSGRQLAASTMTTVAKGTFEVPFAIYAQKNLPGAYTAELVFAVANQQAEVRKRMGPKFREVTGTAAFSLGSKEEFAAAAAERRRDVAKRFDLLESIAREAEAVFHEFVQARQQADWPARSRAWITRIDAGLEGMDRLDNLCIPEINRAVGHLTVLHEEIEQYVEAIGRVLANAKKPETIAWVIKTSDDFAGKLRFARIAAGIQPGTLQDLGLAMRAVVEALTHAAKEKNDATRRAFQEAVLAASPLVPKKGMAHFAEACAKAAKALESGASVEEAVLQLGDVVTAAAGQLPK